MAAIDASKLTTLRFEQTGHVGRLTLARPDTLNAFTVEMWSEMRALGAALLADPGDLRALVVIGEGRAFSSGIDTSVFTDNAAARDSAESGSAESDAVVTGALGPMGEGADDDPVAATILGAQDAYTWLAEVPFATIAAVRGYALGAGLQLALACDLRVVARGTKLGLLEFKYGIIPDLGGTQRLPRLVGAGKAKELIFTAAKFDADDAERLGIAERVVSDEELDEEAFALARVIAAQPPLAVQGAKRAVEAAGSGLSVREGLRVEATAQAVCLRSDDMKEAITAFIEGREPVYQGR
ncbi:MAG TPA: enoyl-CoA hydratase/isomerase family protein [Acidimicrobiia bacterium]|nr:enoyl-CoA hydratase/isomerase family protein [Acidimicrobiia bacterium]